MKRIFISIILIAFIGCGLCGQRKITNIPDIPGFITLKCDFHMHTVFSDGDVWPIYRVYEAYRDGLDAIAITDHIEYTPKKEYIPVDLNAAWKIAEASAREGNIILIHGAEITRDMPPGHLNALFITDAASLRKDSVYDAVEAAVKQGAFIQWNHPGWKAQEKDGIPKLYSIHKRLLEKGWLNGIELFNETEYYPLILEWCKKYNLAVTGNSDIHDIISEAYPSSDNKTRPMTLVFAKERTSTSIKEALFAGRTLVYANNMIEGKEEYAKPFFFQCISVGKVYLQNNRNSYFEISNKSDMPFYLINGPEGAPGFITLNANSITRVVLSNRVTVPLTYDVKNIITGEKSFLKVELKK